MAGKKKQMPEEVETRQKITLKDIEEVLKHFEKDFVRYTHTGPKKQNPLKIIKEIIRIYRDHVAKLPDKNADLNVAKNRPTILRQDLMRQCLNIEEPDSGVKKEFSGYKRQINETLRDLMFNKENGKCLNPLGLVLKKAEQSRTAGEGETSNYFVSIKIPKSPLLAEEKKELSAVYSKVELARELKSAGKNLEAIKAMMDALGIARTEGAEKEEVEILLNLAFLSHGRGIDGRSDLQYYFQEAEKRADKIQTNLVKVLYFRAKATVLESAGDLIGAEEVYKAALETCQNGSEDEKENLDIQECVVRAEYVSNLCNQNKLEEARPLLTKCEEYARQNKYAFKGEMFQAALGAGIRFSLAAGDEDGVIQRIAELEQFANTPRLKNQIGGNLIDTANHASKREAHRAALAAAETSIRLIRPCYDDSSYSFLPVALYTEALVISRFGDDNKAFDKAKLILDSYNSPEYSKVRQKTISLISRILRDSGDSQNSVKLARKALNSSSGRPEETAFCKAHLAEALNDNGQTEKALVEAKGAWSLAQHTELLPEYSVNILGQIANYASQFGIEKDTDDALQELEKIPDETEKIKSEKNKITHRVLILPHKTPDSRLEM